MRVRHCCVEGNAGDEQLFRRRTKGGGISVRDAKQLILEVVGPIGANINSIGCDLAPFTAHRARNQNGSGGGDEEG